MAPRKGQPWPWNAFPKPSPADWGFGMTLCIAASAYNGKFIVSASDHMVSLPDFAADDVALKSVPIHSNWFALFAGDDLAYVDPVLASITIGIRDLKDAAIGDVVHASVESFQRWIRKRREDEVLLSLGWTLDKFNDEGKEKLTTSVFNGLMSRMNSTNLGCEFLVFGFDATGSHVFSVKDPGCMESHDVCGFWAIGSGMYSALSSMFFHSFGFKMSLLEAVYYVLEAKFFGERAGGVGKKTFLSIHERDRKPFHLPFAVIEEIRTLWETKGAPRRPPESETLILKAIREWEMNKGLK